MVREAGSTEINERVKRARKTPCRRALPLDAHLPLRADSSGSLSLISHVPFLSYFSYKEHDKVRESDVDQPPSLDLCFGLWTITL